jgi:hypothetical protein
MVQRNGETRTDEYDPFVRGTLPVGVLANRGVEVMAHRP